jgi:hypothetical protein
MKFYLVRETSIRGCGYWLTTYEPLKNEIDDLLFIPKCVNDFSMQISNYDASKICKTVLNKDDLLPAQVLDIQSGSVKNIQELEIYISKGEQMNDRINPSTWVGKTIKSVDNKAINVVHFEFTDGSKITLDTERGPYGIAVIVENESEGYFDKSVEDMDTPLNTFLKVNVIDK